jgi:hypothetical protein
MQTVITTNLISNVDVRTNKYNYNKEIKPKTLTHNLNINNIL